MNKLKLEELQIDQKRKKESLSRIAILAEGKKEYYKPSFFEILKGQIRYSSPFCFIGQFICIALVLGLTEVLHQNNGEVQMYLAAISGTMAFMGIFLIMELSRCQSFHTAEIEQACFLNLKQVWCIKMVLFGALDMIGLTLILAVQPMGLPWELGSMMLYLLVPFVVSNALYLVLFSMVRGREKQYIQMAAAFLISGLAMLPVNFPILYTGAYLGIWMLVLVIFTSAMGAEIIYIRGELVKGGAVCWN